LIQFLDAEVTIRIINLMEVIHCWFTAAKPSLESSSVALQI
jgi:hypothetical protein